MNSIDGTATFLSNLMDRNCKFFVSFHGLEFCEYRHVLNEELYSEQCSLSIHILIATSMCQLFGTLYVINQIAAKQMGWTELWVWHLQEEASNYHDLSGWELKWEDRNCIRYLSLCFVIFIVAECWYYHFKYILADITISKTRFFILVHSVHMNETDQNKNEYKT